MKKTIRENAAIILATMCLTASAISILFPLYAAAGGILTASAISILFPLYAAAGGILTFLGAVGIAALCLKQFSEDNRKTAATDSENS